MIYETANDWLNAREKRVALFGMSGLGKTHVSNLLRSTGGWFHYSVDFRIGTRYMGEHIVDNFKAEAMRNPFLAELLRSDSIYIASNITFNNLAPLSTYLGMPGDPAKGGLTMAEYKRRQAQHRAGEISALLDTPHFIDRAQRLYGYRNFICDCGGSICEVVDPDDPDDPVLTALSGALLPVWIEGTDAHTEELINRFDKAPKPIYHDPGFLDRVWAEYLSKNKLKEDEVDPHDFIRFAYADSLAHRRPLYQAMAAKWGVTVRAEDVAQVTDARSFETLIARALEAR